MTHAGSGPVRQTAVTAQRLRHRVHRRIWSAYARHIGDTIYSPCRANGLSTSLFSELRPAHYGW